MNQSLSRATDRIRASGAAFERIRRHVAGGDSSDARFRAGQLPTVAVRGAGARFWDLDGNGYIDLQLAYGPLILGHTHPAPTQAAMRQLDEGSMFGMPSLLSGEVAERVASMVPGIELLRFASTGNEAVSSAVRLGRYLSGHPGVLKFEGHFHGSSDLLFADHRPPVEDVDDTRYLVRPRTGGLPISTLGGLSHARWNDIESVTSALDEKPDIGVIILEPIMANAGVVPPQPGFLEAVRSLATRRGICLIFDEVVTGFRVAPGGAQERYGVVPDITVLGKILGGGFPLAAFGGSLAAMQPLVTGKVSHGGTHAGHPVALAAGGAVLAILDEDRDRVYRHLESVGSQLEAGIAAAAGAAQVAVRIQRVGAMLQVFVLRPEAPDESIDNYTQARSRTDTSAFRRLHILLQYRGTYIHPDQHERLLLSVAHDESTISEAVDHFGDAFDALRS